jgi:hypothetical protein
LEEKMVRFNLDEYVPVQERIISFWQDHPQGRIITALMSDTADFKTCRYAAQIFTDREDERPAATGWAFEIAGGNSANATSHEENAETSAIGRALANLGYATSQKDRPSREEMSKVNRFEEREPTPMDARQRAQVDATYEQVSRQHSPDPTGAYPALSRLHGVNTMKDVNDYIQSHGFRGGNKGECIRELQGTYKADIRPAHGRTEPDGSATIFPGDIYDFAAFHIGRAEAEPMALEQ